MQTGFLILFRSSGSKALSCWSCKCKGYYKHISVNFDSGVDFNDPEYGFKEEDKELRKVNPRRFNIQTMG